jgi:hypothetical protein
MENRGLKARAKVLAIVTSEINPPEGSSSALVSPTPSSRAQIETRRPLVIRKMN